MTRKLHVGNLSPSVTDEELRELFTPFGDVEFAATFTDETNRVNRSFGLVEMIDVNAATHAMRWLNFTTHEGQVMTVSLFEGQNREQ
jgi:RNA recognition motif-containing protein